MTPQIAIWIASIVGAVAFFVAGYAKGHRPALPAPAPPDHRERDGLREQISALKARAQQAHASSEAVRIELERRLAGAQAELGTLQAELAKAQARAAKVHVVAAPPASRPVVMASPGSVRGAAGTIDPLRPAPPPASTGHALNAVLARLGGQQGTRAVALADDLGLLVAGVGEAATPLAAFGALLRQIASRGREYLPLGAFRRVEVEDELHATVCVSPLSIHDAELALVTLSSGRPPTELQVSRILREAATVIG